MTAANTPAPVRFPEALLLPATGREVAQFVALRAGACVGADYSNIALLNATGDSLRLFHGPFLEPQVADRYTDVPLSAPFPIAAAAREGVSVLLPDLDAYRDRFDSLLADTVEAGIQATASLPLHRADGTLLGAIGFAWGRSTAFDVKLETALRAVAQLCVETMERAERYDAEHELIVALQARLIGGLPTLAGLETAARYLPASSVPSVGGDWYEGLVLGDERMAVVVGDVTGHGIIAAADMTLIRGMISALLHSGVPAADVFTELSGVLAQRGTLLMATAALVIIDVGAGTVTFTTAGHPPPLLRYPDGQVRALDHGHGPMIGLTHRRHIAGTAPFPPGSQLVLYTDGLVERRDRPFDVGVHLATTHLATLPEPLAPTDLIDSLLAELVGDGAAEDDIAVLVVERST